MAGCEVCPQALLSQASVVCKPMPLKVFEAHWECWLIGFAGREPLLLNTETMTGDANKKMFVAAGLQVMSLDNLLNSQSSQLLALSCVYGSYLICSSGSLGLCGKQEGVQNGFFASPRRLTAGLGPVHVNPDLEKR